MVKDEIDFKKHWNKAYKNKSMTELGWYEEYPEPSIELIKLCDLPAEAKIFNAGAGSSTLINELINLGFKNIFVNDISSEAIESLKVNLSKKVKSNINFIVDDLTNPTELTTLKDIDLWHERAVLHFFTEISQQKIYFELINQSVKPGGYVIIAEFNLKGAKNCSGLNIVNYDKKMLQNGLGKNFKLIKSFDYTYIQPSGNSREFVYCLFKKNS